MLLVLTRPPCTTVALFPAMAVVWKVIELIANIKAALLEIIEVLNMRESPTYYLNVSNYMQ